MRPLVICGSQRFKTELDRFVLFLEKRGVQVFRPNFKHHRKRFSQKREELRLRSTSYRAKVPGLVWAHFNNLDLVKSLSGICLIFNPRPLKEQRKKYGYIGSNTQGEIGYAGGLKMPVIFLRPHEEKWIMTIAHENDRNRIFSLKHSKSNALDFDFVWQNWLKGWLDG